MKLAPTLEAQAVTETRCQFTWNLQAANQLPLTTNQNAFFYGSSDKVLPHYSQYLLHP